jgi:hypothetical protein
MKLHFERVCICICTGYLRLRTNEGGNKDERGSKEEEDGVLPGSSVEHIEKHKQ